MSWESLNWSLPETHCTKFCFSFLFVQSKLQDILAELEGDHETEKRKLDGAELLEEVDISDMNLDDFKESGDEFILDTDKTADLLEEFRQAMANQPEVSDDEKDEVILLKSQSMAQPESDEEASDSLDDEQDGSDRKLEGAELLEEVDISDMNLDDFKESGDEFILDTDNTADLLEEFRQAMANQGEVSDDEKDEVLPLHSKPNIENTENTEDEQDDGEHDHDTPDQDHHEGIEENIADHHHHHHDEIEENKDRKLEGAELLEEVDISDMNLDDFKESGDEFILDSDNTADLLEEFRQAMANQGEVAEDEKDEVIPMKSSPNIERPDDNGHEEEEHLDDEEVNELDLDTMEPAQSHISDFEDNSADAEKAYPENPDSFVSEVLSNLNGEE